MLQRLGLAQALLHEPQLLILDEPTDGLDPGARAEMRQIIRRLKGDGVTIFLNSHLLQEVEMICDRVAILNKGILRYCGDVTAIGDFSSGDKTQTVVEVDVAGNPTNVNAGFGERKFEIVERLDNEQFKVKVTLKDQSEVDALVDDLRSNGVSIQGLARQQVTLEDAFLKIVSDHSPGGNVDSKLDDLFK